MGGGRVGGGEQLTRDGLILYKHSSLCPISHHRFYVMEPRLV